MLSSPWAIWPLNLMAVYLIGETVEEYEHCLYCPKAGRESYYRANLNRALQFIMLFMLLYVLILFQLVWSYLAVACDNLRDSRLA